MFKFRVLGTEDIKKVADMREVIAGVEKVYCAKSNEEAVAWPTTFYEFDPGKRDMDIKSGWLKSSELYGHKMVGFFGDNAEKGLPTLVGLIVVYDAMTGAPLGVVDGGYVTGLRTGAAGAIGAKYLARKDSRHLFLLGAGNQAAFQIAATLLTFPAIDKVRIADTFNPENGKRFAAGIAERLKNEFGIDAPKVAFEAVDPADEAMAAAVGDSDIVITVTPSRKPQIKSEWVKPGTHFSCIGSDAEGKEEIEAEISKMASRIFCDDMGHALEAGEIEIPLKQGLIKAEDVTEIGKLIQGQAEGRQSDDEITLYDAVGMALMDIATAKTLLDLAADKGLGQVVEI